MSLDNLRIYRSAAELNETISAVVLRWQSFHRWTLGTQLIRATDSVMNNIAEGYGRGSTGDVVRFMMFADASIQECKAQLSQAVNRGLITYSEKSELDSKLAKLSISIVEFCFARMKRDPQYTGVYRTIIDRRRKWLLERFKRPE